MASFATFIDEMVVEGPQHDAVAEFVENVLKKRTPPSKETPPTYSCRSEPHLLDSSFPTPSRYALPKTDQEVLAARQAAVPDSTQKDTKWCLKVWQDWSTS